MVPPDGSFAAAIAKDNHKRGEIQTAFEVDQHLESETDPHRGEQDKCGAAGCKHERYFETSNEMRSVLIKIDPTRFDHRPGQKIADESFVKSQTQASL